MNLKAKREMTEEQKEFIDKWLIILLSLDDFKPIKGKTRLVKEFFLIWKKYFDEKGNIAEFYPYHFGPYSTLLAVRVNKLFFQKTIKFIESGQDISYALAENEGAKALNLIEHENPIIISEISKIKAKYAKVGIGKLLGYVYRNYPEFSEYSIAKETSTIKGKLPEEIIPKYMIDDGYGFVKASYDDIFKVSDKYKKIVFEKLQE